MPDKMCDVARMDGWLSEKTRPTTIDIYTIVGWLLPEHSAFIWFFLLFQNAWLYYDVRPNGNVF